MRAPQKCTKVYGDQMVECVFQKRRKLQLGTGGIDAKEILYKRIDIPTPYEKRIKFF